MIWRGLIDGSWHSELLSFACEVIDELGLVVLMLTSTLIFIKTLWTIGIYVMFKGRQPVHGALLCSKEVPNLSMYTSIGDCHTTDFTKGLTKAYIV